MLFKQIDPSYLLFLLLKNYSCDYWFFLRSICNTCYISLQWCRFAATENLFLSWGSSARQSGRPDRTDVLQGDTCAIRGWGDGGIKSGFQGNTMYGICVDSFSILVVYRTSHSFPLRIIESYSPRL